MKNSYLNTFRKETVFPIILDEKSSVSIELFETGGRRLFSVIDHESLAAGIQEIKISRNRLDSGRYSVKVTIENSRGKFIENIDVTVK